MKTLLFTILSVLVALGVALPLGMLHAKVEWPDCNWNCTSGDVTVTRVWLGDDTGAELGTCDPGDPVTAYIWVRIYNGTGTERYAVRLIFDLYIDDTPISVGEEVCVAEIGPKATFEEYVYGPIPWTCGEEVQLRGPSDLGGPVLSWSVNAELCSDAPTCASRQAQCYGPLPLIVAAPLVVDFTTDSPKCFCNDITFTDTTTGGVTPYTYIWDFNNDGTPELSGYYPNPSYHYTAPGTYTVKLTVTDSDAPPKSDWETHSVTVYANPTATASNDGPACVGGDVQLTGGPGGMSIYSWSGPGGYSNSSQSPTLTNVDLSDAGTYTLTVTDANGCTDSADTIVVVNAGPTADAGDDQEILCGEGSVQIGGDPTGSGGTGTLTYSWTPTTGLNDPAIANPTASAAGTYTVRVTDENGCWAEDSVVVTVIGAPTADAGDDEEICPGGSVVIGGDPTASGGTPPYSYSWTPTEGLDDATLANPTASPASTTTYSVLVTDDNGCEASDSVTVTVNELPDCTITAPSVVAANSTGNSASVADAGAGATYEWTVTGGAITAGDGTSSIVWTAGAGPTVSIGVTVTNANSCSATCQATVSVTTQPATTDVAVTKTDNPDPVTAGHLLTYTIRVINNGPLAAEGVLLTDDIPDEILDPEYSLDGGVNWNPWTGSLSLGTMAAGQLRQILIRGIVDPSFIGRFCNTAVVGSTTSDSNLANNQDTECTNVISIPGCTLELTCPPDVTVECDESTDPSNTGWATAIGNCDPVVTFEDSVSGTCPTIITRTWTATDTGGNMATCTQIITVVDITPPVLTVPPDVTVGYGQPTDVSHTGWATATDNCDPDPEITYSDTESAGCCAITIVRLWTATDDCGNSSSAAQTIKVTDVTPPELTVPDDLTLEYGMSLPPANTGGWATAVDDRDPSPTIIYRDSSSGTCPVVITRTWIATDDVGNSASAVQIITLVDTLAPELTVPADVTREFGQSTSPYNTGWAAAIDNFDPSPEIAYSDSSSDTCPMTITRSWTATDCCGNTASAVQTIMMVDTTPPILNVRASVSVECGQSTDPSHTGWATAFDNFDPSPEVTYSDSSSGTCPTIITRTWTATDSCGYSASAVQTITVADTTRPVLTLPGDITIGSGDSIDPSNTGQATATDVGDTSVQATYEDILSGDHIIRIWTATDDSGNSVSGIQIITISGGGFPLWLIAPILVGALLALVLAVLLGRRERHAPGGLM
jgi:uncharacterized repeat protein (TIGR01451 family)